MSELVNSANVILRALSGLAIRGKPPVLVCLPDILILRSTGSNQKVADAERVEVPMQRIALDGHACISALTAANLCFGPAGEYSVWLAAKAGPVGRRLLNDTALQLRLAGCRPMRTFLADGLDREITTPEDVASKVSRAITPSNGDNQLEWDEVSAHDWRPWLTRHQYGVVLGEAESAIVTSDTRHLAVLLNGSSATVIDTLVWEQDPGRTRAIWGAIQKAADNATFVSISFDDASPLVRALGIAVAETTSELGAALAATCPQGFVLLHGKDSNWIFRCSTGEIVAASPACDIKPVSTNGAGDTFNGAFALAVTALSAGSQAPRNFDSESLRHALRFATAVVSLRLQSARYASRSEFMLGLRALSEKQFVGPPTPVQGIARNMATEVNQTRTEESQVLAHLLHPVWTDVQRVALVDLDHTLCDSDTWRQTAAAAAFDKLGLTEMGLYSKIYAHHEHWARLFQKDVRYLWRFEELFHAVLSLQRLGVGPEEYDEFAQCHVTGKWPVPFTQDYARSRESPDDKQLVKAALHVFDSVPAIPLCDSVAGLLQLRDILGFELHLVTEGDRETQLWKLVKLGLRDLFVGVQAEQAFAPVRHVDEAFAQAMCDADEALQRKLRQAQRICTEFRKELKANFRLNALREAIASGAVRQHDGVHACTIGDRIDTDVMPFLEARRNGMLGPASAGGSRGGLVVTRVIRGPYRDTGVMGEHMPDLSGDSIPDIAIQLSAPAFWRDQPTIAEVKQGSKPEIKHEDYLLLREIKKSGVNAGLALPIVESVLDGGAHVTATA